MNMRSSTTCNRESRYDKPGSSLVRSLCDGHLLVLYILPFLSSLFASVGDSKSCKRGLMPESAGSYAKAV